MESGYAHKNERKTRFSCNVLVSFLSIFKVAALVWAREWGCFSKKWRKGLFSCFWSGVRKAGSGVGFLRVGAPHKWV